MKLYIVRHSQTNYNVLGLCNADPSVDVHLTELGIQQTQNLRELLKNVNYDRVYISELPRTRQTAEIINEYHNKPLIVEPLINENKTGFENEPAASWYKAIGSGAESWTVSFNEGESRDDARKRAEAFVAKLKKDKPANTILVVTHGFITQMIFGALENKDKDEAAEFNLPQGSYAEFEL